MVIEFDVGGSPAEFELKQVGGAAQLRVGDDTIQLQNPLRPSAQFSLRRTKTWTCQTAGHDVSITRVRPLWVAGFRPSSFSVSVDGAVVAQARGR